MNLIKEYFMESLARHTERDALEIGGNKYSYKELADVVDRISGYIQDQGFENTAIVVLNEHTLHSYAGILAVLFSNNTVLPIERSWPQQRIGNVMKTAQPAAVLFDEEEVKNELICIEESSSCCFINTASGEATHGSSLKKSFSTYSGIAYLIFTSGSTGEPKGVPVKVSSLEAFVKYYKTEYDFKECDRFLQVYDITFDVAYFSFLVPLSVAACCCILNSKKGRPKYLSIVDDLLKRKITVVSMVPSILPFVRKYLSKYQVDSVRYSFFSGDALYHKDALIWQSFVPRSAIHNCYGPTETTIVCARYIWDKEEAYEELNHDIVPLGKPFPDMQFQIVDEENKEVQKGEVGELCFAGVQVIDQYLNNVKSESFFKVSGESGDALFYKTGDLASLSQHGNLIFHGRKDFQVKINGYRIELEEVQLALQKVMEEDCVVIKKTNSEQVAYLKVFVAGETREVEEIRLALNNYLPDYMIPSEFEFIDQIPLSENGKINKRYLQSL